MAHCRLSNATHFIKLHAIENLDAMQYTYVCAHIMKPFRDLETNYVRKQTEKKVKAIDITIRVGLFLFFCVCKVCAPFFFLSFFFEEKNRIGAA